MGCTSQLEHSKKYVQLVLKNVSAAQVNGLARILSAQLESLTKKSTQAGTGRGSDESVALEKLRTSTKTALECVQQVETLFRLQHLARCAIIRAMSYRSLCDDLCLKKLGVPKNLQQYLRLNLN